MTVHLPVSSRLPTYQPTYLPTYLPAYKYQRQALFNLTFSVNSIKEEPASRAQPINVELILAVVKRKSPY